MNLENLKTEIITRILSKKDKDLDSYLFEEIFIEEDTEDIKNEIISFICKEMNINSLDKTTINGARFIDEFYINTNIQESIKWVTYNKDYEFGFLKLNESSFLFQFDYETETCFCVFN